MDLFVIVILRLISVSVAQDSPIEKPEHTLSVVGSNATLRCSSLSGSCNGVEWAKYPSHAWGAYSMAFVFSDSYRESTNKGFSVDESSGCDLIVENVKPKDAGIYECKTSSNVGWRIEKRAQLIILEAQPRCTINASVDNTLEGDGVLLTCKVTFHHLEADEASMIWKGVDNAPAPEKIGKTLSRSYYVAASAPEIPPFTCIASFFAAKVRDPGGKSFENLAKNIPAAICATSAVKVLYSVRNVSLSPSLSAYSSGSVITCMAKGRPSPTCKWQEMENGSTWMEIHNENGCKFTVTGVSSKWYRCVAMNVVRGNSYNAISDEFRVDNTCSEFNDDLSSTKPIVSEDRLVIGGIGIGIGVLATILLATVVVAILIRRRYLEFHPRPANKSPDIAQSVGPPSGQLGLSSMDRSIPKTGAPLVGEREPGYSSLREDREVIHYESIT